MDKSLILNKIKKHLGFDSDKDFANFLGIKQNTLSTWKSRNKIDYDLIIAKCEKINANWLITGKGSMITGEEELNLGSVLNWLLENHAELLNTKEYNEFMDMVIKERELLNQKGEFKARMTKLLNSNLI